MRLPRAEPVCAAEPDERHDDLDDLDKRSSGRYTIGMTIDDRRFSEACLRNRDPIGDELARILPERGLVLEIGAGTGQHAVDFSTRFPGLTWQPADRSDNLPSIEAWRQHSGSATPNLRPALPFDLFDDAPPVASADAVLAINVLHIAPADAIPRLFAHARSILGPGGLIIVYGPFRYPDHPLEPSNLAFERTLQATDPRRGIRDVTTLDAYAASLGFRFGGDVALPANNHLRWWVSAP